MALSSLLIPLFQYAFFCETQAVVQALELHGAYHIGVDFTADTTLALTSLWLMLLFCVFEYAGCGASPRAAWRLSHLCGVHARTA
jgi:hypothetical protein